jgi:small-conductance mechanosensitive channel
VRGAGRSRLRLPPLLLLLACTLATGGAAASGGAGGIWRDLLRPVAAVDGEAPGEDSRWFEAGALNAGLPAAEPSPNLLTPQATLEYFLSTARNGEYLRAAHALNLNLIPLSEQAEQAPRLARRLLYLLENRVSIDWERLPDRRDGRHEPSLLQETVLSGSGTDPARLRRSISVGSLSLGDRPVSIRIQRLRPAGGQPRWVFSAQTVENIPSLYQHHGPGWIERRLPGDWHAVLIGSGAGDWAAFMLAALAIGLGAWLLSRLGARLARRSPGSPLGVIAESIRRPLALLIALLTLREISRALFTLNEPMAGLINAVLGAAAFLTAVWLTVALVTAFLSAAESHIQERRRQTHSTGRLPLLTWIAVSRRVVIFLLVVVGLGLALWQLPGFRSVGVSLLVSAGLLSVLVGVAANTFLANLIGSVQIGLTRPVEIGENVRFEGEWGYIEDIGYTYLVLRTWDERRWMIPLQYFLSRPVENLSRTNPSTVLSVYVHADYRVDVERVREHYRRILENDEDWDRTIPPYLLVTGAAEETVELRAVCSASDPVKAFFFSCRLREKLIHYLQALEGGRYLPRRRLEPVPHELGEEDMRRDTEE